MKLYDPLDNVRSASFGSVTHTFAYDVGVNRLDRIDSDAAAPFSIEYDYNDQGDTTLRQISTPGSAPIFVNGFEGDGARSSAPGRQWVENVVATQTLLYDRAHRLTGVSGIENYVYDAHGHRVAIVRASDGNRRYQIYSRDGRFLYSEFDGEIVDYVHVDGELVAERRPPVGGVPLIVRYAHADMRGSPVVYSNSAGSLLRRTVYEPYGTTRDGQYIDGPGFTGHVTDVSTGLSYMQQRYYDPIAFRFLSPDPVPSSSNSFNVYWYANNNPYKYLDPDGAAAVTFEQAAVRIGTSGSVALVDSPAPGPADVIAVGLIIVTLIDIVVEISSGDETTPTPNETDKPASDTSPSTSLTDETPPPSPEDPEDGKNFRKLSPGEIKQLKEQGEDIHELKGKGSSRYDLYKDKDGNVYQMLKGGKGEPEKTGINIKQAD